MPLESIAYFISSHGFGHAARSAAVMQAIAEYDPSIQFEIFTAVPAWFFQDSLSTPFNYHHLLTDFGLAQKTGSGNRACQPKAENVQGPNPPTIGFAHRRKCDINYHGRHTTKLRFLPETGFAKGDQICDAGCRPGEKNPRQSDHFAPSV
jgi:hypothetical protein